MAKFDVGDKVYCRDCPDDVCTVMEVDTMESWLPNYTLIDSSGNIFNSLCLEWDKVVTANEVLRYGEALTDEQIHCFPNGKVGWIRIRTISYDNRIFYHKMVNGEVVEFKELTK